MAYPEFDRDDMREEIRKAYAEGRRRGLEEAAGEADVESDRWSGDAAIALGIAASRIRALLAKEGK